MKKNLALLMAMLMLFSALAGCAVTTGGQEKAEAPKAEAPAAQAPAAEAPAAEAAPAAPAKDSVTISVPQELTTTDGHATTKTNDLITLFQMYEGLFYLNEAKGVIENRLCESYTTSDDGLEYTFKLREDAYFHNGEQVKASDVVFSYNRAKESAHVGAFLGAMESVEAVDDFTVKFTTAAPNAPLMVSLTQVFVLSEKEVTEAGDAFGTTVSTAGTGPFMMTALDNDVAWSLEAFPQYYRGEASIKKITVKPITDASAGLLAFESGELDFYSAGSADWASLVANEKYNTEAVAANHITLFAVNHEANDVLANDLVRQAIAYALNKEDMNWAAFDGYATEASFMENPAYNIGAPTEGVTYEYNPEKAKELLAEAGYPDGVNAGKLMVWAGNYFEKMAQVAQQNLAAVGITVELDYYDINTCISKMLAQDYEIGIMGYASNGDFDSFRKRFHSAQEGAYYVDFTANDKFDWQTMDALMDESAQTLDAAKRLEINGQINDMVMETACLLPCLHKALFYVWNGDLNIVCQPNYIYIYEWSWN